MSLSSLFLSLLHRLRKDPVLYAALLLAVISMFFIPPSLSYIEYLDLRVLGLLLALMLVVSGLKGSGVFDLLIYRLLRLVHSSRALLAVLVGICFFTSMFITNDVALISFVPLAILLLNRSGQQKLIIITVVLQTVAANLGSMLTPLGNPQNLYLYSLADMSVSDLLRLMSPFCAASLLLLAISLFCLPSVRLEAPDSAAPAVSRRDSLIWLLLFIFCLLAVVRVIPYRLALLAVVATALLFDRGLIKQADYGLLLTFIFFFIFVGNIRQLPQISTWLSSMVDGRETAVGILLSQIISNVPAAMLLSGFTDNYSALLLGVDIGGLGTLIASMASVISYKLYAALPEARPGRFLGVFTAVNIAFLAVLVVLLVIIG